MQVSLDQDGTCFGGKCVVGIGRCNQKCREIRSLYVFKNWRPSALDVGLLKKFEPFYIVV